MEEVDEFSVIHLRHEVEHQVGYGVVDPVEQDSRENAACAVIHPAQQQTDQKGVRALRQVQVDGAEDEGGEHDGCPVGSAAKDVQQRAQHCSAEHDLLGYRSHDAQGEIAPGGSHDAFEQLLCLRGEGQIDFLCHELHREYRACRQQECPEKDTPGARPEVGARHRCPAGTGEEGEGEQAADDSGDGNGRSAAALVHGGTERYAPDNGNTSCRQVP